MAPYSNHGPAGHDWVDVYTRGSDVVNAYPNGPYVYSQPPRGNGAGGAKDEVIFKNGMAKWSGTSFSTPIVAGIIAVRMMAKNQTSMEAAEDLKKIAHAKVNNPGDLPTLKLEDALEDAP